MAILDSLASPCGVWLISLWSMAFCRTMLRREYGFLVSNLLVEHGFHLFGGLGGFLVPAGPDLPEQ